MLLPRSHAWTPLQKRIIAALVVLGVAAFAALVYGYERHHRGPTDRVLVGTWHCDMLNTTGANEVYYRFNPDHTYHEFYPDLPRDDEKVGPPSGTWYAGGDFIYLRIPRENTSGPLLEAWHIDTMTPTELQIHCGPDHDLLKRVQ
jgi:hypothetical protein